MGAVTGKVDGDRVTFCPAGAGAADEILDFIGINWPNVEEDDYREMADAMCELADACGEMIGWWSARELLPAKVSDGEVGRALSRRL
jgi:hypothetical protein